VKALESAQLQVDVNLDADLQPGSRIATPAGEVTSTSWPRSRSAAATTTPTGSSS
jgi:hypothetical protein